MPTLVDSPFALGGASAWRNPGGAVDLRRTSGVPDDALFTACGYAVLDSDTNTYGNIFSLEDGVASAPSGIYLQTDADGTTLTWVAPGTGGNITVAALTLGRPFFWAIASGGVGVNQTDAYYMPLGARSFTTVGNPGGRNNFTPTTLFIGNDSWAEPWPGRIWGVRVWDARLSAAELLREVGRGYPRRRPSLHAWWLLEGQLAHAVLDRSGNGRHLTQTGTAAVGKFFLPRSVLRPPVVDDAAKAAGGGTTYSADAADSISLTDSASSTAAFEAAATDAAVLADSASASLTLAADASDSIALADTAAGGLVFESAAADGLSLADESSGSPAFNRDASDSLSLADSASAQHVIAAQVDDAIALADSASAQHTMPLGATDSIALADSSSAMAVLQADAAYAITLTDSATAALADPDRSATDSMTLADSSSTAGNVFNVTATDAITLTDAATAVIPGGTPTATYVTVLGRRRLSR